MEEGKEAAAAAKGDEGDQDKGGSKRDAATRAATQRTGQQTWALARGWRRKSPKNLQTAQLVVIPWKGCPVEANYS